MILTHKVTPEDAGAPLLTILRRRMGLSGGAVRALKAHGGLLVDDVLRFTTYQVSPGETVSADVGRAQTLGDNLPEQGPLAVLWEDEGLVAVNKPPGQIVHPSRAKNHGALSNFVAGYLEKTNQPPICHVVNRLDRDTSGVVLFAKNAHMKARAAGALKTAQKRYTALLFGALDPADGLIDLPIRRAVPKQMRRIVAVDGKEARTRYRTIAMGECVKKVCTVAELFLETGRTHQIRVHCLAQNTPLLGDPLYHTADSAALSAALGIKRQLLHSHYLSFTHPLTGRTISIDAPIEDVVFFDLLAAMQG